MASMVIRLFMLKDTYIYVSRLNVSKRSSVKDTNEESYG